MKIFVLLVVFLFSYNCMAGDLEEDSCPRLYQGWVLNLMIEDACNFGGALAYRLGSAIKKKCDSELTEEVRRDLDIEVARAVKSDYQLMGHDAFCEDAKPGYDEVVSELTKGRKKWPRMLERQSE